ncbi:transporter substrate-binding domain-containing protein [Rhizobium sp. TRM95111]|uniref:substrate-binding periplasmic protein n=1 Tax=Rhizobium alarense TaxID=2846851 RepID=UPI001F451906|nr:transporter substrate-binding domain-containing protein [Rhizobium alarense]MCF3640723.1 transporter substrate-binding domain-containing protein [Rhizobium alarense]
MKTLLCAAFAFLLSGPALADEITFVTEEYAPFNYTDNGKVTGISVDQVHAIAAAAGLDYRIEIMPWARAIALAETQPNHCVFTTGHNRTRHERFLWVEPLLKDHMVMVKRRGGTVTATTLDEARALRVGSQRGDFAVEALEEQGFADIDLAADIDVTLGKLISGRIDLMPTSVKTFEKMVQDGHPVQKAMLMDGQIYSIACHKDLSRNLIATMQRALKDLIASGEQDRIFTRYGLPPNTQTADVK